MNAMMNFGPMGLGPHSTPRFGAQNPRPFEGGFNPYGGKGRAKPRALQWQMPIGQPRNALMGLWRPY